MSSIPNSGDRPLTAILGSMLGNVQEILRSEVRLARAEVRDSVADFSRGVSWLVTGVVSAFFAVSFLLGAGFFALSEVFPRWIAALMMAGALAVICGVSLGVRNSISRKLATRQTDLADQFHEAQSQESSP